jgi:hypothetical protein
MRFDCDAGTATLHFSARWTSLTGAAHNPGDSVMTTRPPAEIGMSLDEVGTPALVINLDAFERNLRCLAERIAGSPVRARPHAKTHKCAVIALKRVELGTVGVERLLQQPHQPGALFVGEVKIRHGIEVATGRRYTFGFWSGL